ncbi:putative transcription factor E2F-DP family [Helianthus annuus]|nr:putative transcription factor E2F-DP family [Helianthus annuus]
MSVADDVNLSPMHLQQQQQIALCNPLIPNNHNLPLFFFPPKQTVINPTPILQGSIKTELVYDHSFGPSSCGVGKRNRQPKTTKKAKSGKQEPNTDSYNLNFAGACRYDSSLGLLTKKFVSLIQADKDGILDLNKAAVILDVQKRRIYDITNVLEGIGLVEKATKNHIRWKGHNSSSPRSQLDNSKKLKAEVEQLHAEESRLDECIRKSRERLNSVELNHNHQKHLYLTGDDLRNIPCFKNQTLIAIRAPRASSIEVPDPDQDSGFSQKQFRLIVRSHTGPIDMYLISESEEQKKSLNETAQEGGGSVNASHQNTNIESLNLFDSQVNGIKKIIPSQNDIADDYWFGSNAEVSASELWGMNLA